MRFIKKLFTSGLVWLWVTVLVLIVDRYTKLWVIHNLSPFEILSVLPIFNLTLIYNTGAAFSFLQHASGWQNIAFGTLAILVSVFILVWLAKISHRDRWLSIALCFILGGALGNLWDRILYGYVIDFFDFHLGTWHFAIFNVADSAICIGAFMLICHWFLQHQK